MADKGEPNNSSTGINIHLVLPDQSQIEVLDIQRDSKISVLIPKYLEEVGLNQQEVSSIYFSYKGKSLNHNNTFESYELDEGDDSVMINVYHRLRGGF